MRVGDSPVLAAIVEDTCTPIGYQTNLMVYGPGGCRVGDYLRIGTPVTVLVGITTVAIVPLVLPS